MAAPRPLEDRKDHMAKNTRRRGDGNEDHGLEPADGITLGPLGNYLGFYLRLAQNASFQAFKRHTGEADLRPGWFAVLSLIGTNPGITPMALARASGRDKSTITPVLRDLMRNRLVKREPIPSDRRSYALSLTPAGEEKCAELSLHAARHDQELDALVGDRKQELLDLLRLIATSLD
jgi:DNA-binding MarR family transcriptional regulator